MTPTHLYKYKYGDTPQLCVNIPTDGATYIYQAYQADWKEMEVFSVFSFCLGSRIWG
jgi:hypothetical protein